MSLKIHIANINFALNKFVLNSLILCDFFFMKQHLVRGLTDFLFVICKHLFFISRIRDLKLSKDLFNIQLENTWDLYFIKQNVFIFALCANSKRIVYQKIFSSNLDIKNMPQPLMSALLKEEKTNGDKT